MEGFIKQVRHSDLSLLSAGQAEATQTLVFESFLEFYLTRHNQELHFWMDRLSAN